jgi:hypothetical protein
MTQCPFCTSDVSAVKLAAHLKREHRGKSNSNEVRLSERCPVCNESFEDGTMKAHLKRQHADSKGHIQGIHQEKPVGGPGKLQYTYHSNTDGEREYDARQRGEALDKLVSAQFKARRKKVGDLSTSKT